MPWIELCRRFPATIMNYAIGIDLGGSSIKAVTATPAGEALSRHNIDFDPDKNMEWAEKIRSLVQRLQQERGGPAGSIGVSAPGLAAADGRSIAYMPERLQGLGRGDDAQADGKPLTHRWARGWPISRRSCQRRRAGDPRALP